LRLDELFVAAGLAGDAPPIAIGGLTADSRRVAPGMLFGALPGVRADGRAFIGEAVARGAAAVLAPLGTAWPEAVPARPLLTEADPRAALARLAAAFAGPQPTTVVAVTGTNGKTSTVEFLRQLWAACGQRAASIGTLGVVAPGGSVEGALTTPDAVALAELLAGLACDGVHHAAMEASSHGLDQRRLDGVRLAAAGFSNLTRDHLDYHGDLAAYRAAKLRLFDTLLPEGAPAVADAALDPPTLDALRAIAVRRRLRLCLVGDDVRVTSCRALPAGQALEVEAFGARHALHLPLPGRFQADNALLALTLGVATGMDVARAVPALAQLGGVRGRLELAAGLPSGAAVYVDYAHTPDALSRALAALRPHASGRLAVVFGAGGDRDPGKRPLMGAACAAAADLLYVTDDNPRSEDPALIRAAVLAGCPGAREIGDRRAAIAAALADLRAGDVLVVAGKGHERGQTIGGETLPFDDVAVVRALAA